MNQYRHLGVYALVIHDIHLLLIKKGRGPYTGMLDMPGGRIEFGEEPEQTLIREIFEETRLKVISYKILCSISTRFQHEFYEEPEDLHHIGIIYTVTVDKPYTVINEDDGHDSLGTVWIPLDALEQYQVTPLTFKALSYFTRI